MRCNRKMEMSLRNLAPFMVALIVLRGAQTWAATITANFENYGGGRYFGVAPFTDPLSGITFNNINSSGGLGACYFNSPAGPSLYHNNVVLEENIPQGTVFWSANFSIHGVLPAPASSLSVDILYDYDRIANPRGPSGVVTLEGFDVHGALVGSISTPPLSVDLEQTHLSLSFTTPISSFSVVADNVSTDYDNISFTAVPEPSVWSIAAVAAIGAMAARCSRRH
jgi:hypothetical protein